MLPVRPTHSVIEEEILVSAHGARVIHVEAAGLVDAKHARRRCEFGLDGQVPAIPLVDRKALVGVCEH